MATFTYINNKMTKLTKLFKNTDIKIAYKTNKNYLQKLNNPHNKDNTTTNGIYKIECQDCNKSVSYTHLDVYKRQAFRCSK